MAKKTSKRAKPSKSAAIVEQVQQNPEAGNAEVAAAVNKQFGLDVTPAYVSTIKSTKGLTKRRQVSKKKSVAKSVKRVGRPKHVSSDMSLSQLQHAKEFADQLGGVGEAKRALDALAGLQG